MIRRKGVQSHDDRKCYRGHDHTERVAEVMIRQKGVQSRDQTERGRVMIRQKWVESHD